MGSGLLSAFQNGWAGWFVRSLCLGSSKQFVSEDSGSEAVRCKCLWTQGGKDRKPPPEVCANQEMRRSAHLKSERESARAFGDIDPGCGSRLKS